MWILDKKRVAQVLSSSVANGIFVKCFSLEKMVQVYKNKNGQTNPKTLY